MWHRVLDRPLHLVDNVRRGGSGSVFCLEVLEETVAVDAGSAFEWNGKGCMHDGNEMGGFGCLRGGFHAECR